MTPKKKVIEKAKEDGTLARVNQLLSAAHVLRCEAANLIGETAELLKCDAVYFCNGWEKSNGCLLEFAASKLYNKKIIMQ